MENTNQHLENISEIRSLMEQSSRFLSLSGLSGVFAGLFALAGAFAAYRYFDYNLIYTNYYHHVVNSDGNLRMDFLYFLSGTSFAVFLCALGIVFYLAYRKSLKNKIEFWTPAARRMLLNLMIPIITGGLYSVILLYQKDLYQVAPSTLIFYGFSLLNASKYTLRDIRYLGACEIILGLLNAVFVNYGLIFWTLGFGFLHIIYGAMMYFKYDR